VLRPSVVEDALDAKSSNAGKDRELLLRRLIHLFSQLLLFII
jgi:hypothetical protein